MLNPKRLKQGKRWESCAICVVETQDSRLKTQAAQQELRPPAPVLRLASCVLLMVLMWAILPISSQARSGAQERDQGTVIRDQGKSLILNRELQLVGEKMFRSRQFKEAREAFGRILDLDSRDALAHYFLGLIEYEEGNIEKAKTRFQIAHECLGSSLGTLELPTDAEQVQLEFPNEYEARVYYRDGWYMRPKGLSTVQTVHSLKAGSTYRIELKPRRKESWIQRGMIGLLLAFSFFLAR